MNEKVQRVELASGSINSYIVCQSSVVARAVNPLWQEDARGELLFYLIMKSGRIVGSYSTGTGTWRSEPVLLDRRTLGDCSRRDVGEVMVRRSRAKTKVARSCDIDAKVLSDPRTRGSTPRFGRFGCENREFMRAIRHEA